MSHAENKFRPLPLLSVINAWRTENTESVFASAVNTANGSLLNFISVISEEVSCQLHSGIMKAARRVALDEIISNVISEFVNTKKAQRHCKLDNQVAKTCSTSGRMVMFTNSRDMEFIYAVTSICLMIS